MLEAVVAMGIMVLVSSLILANYSGAGDRFVTKGVAEGIASSIRQTQAYGLGVREFGLGNNIFPGYGLYFDKTIPSPQYYIIFADSDGGFDYDSPGERVLTEYLQSGITIFELCANVKSNPPGDCTLSSLTAIYLRPNPTVTLKGGASPVCSGAPAGTWCDIEVKIKGKKGTTKTIILWRSGQVSVE